MVEDEPTILAGLKDFLEFHDFSVTVAVDGLEAERTVAKQRFDLILLDLMLPKISGEQLCRKWRQAALNTPIIMLTAKGREKEKVANRSHFRNCWPESMPYYAGQTPQNPSDTNSPSAQSKLTSPH